VLANGRWTIPVLAFIAGLAVWSQLPGPAQPSAAALVREQAELRSLTGEQRAAGLRFAPGVTTGDREAVLAAVAGARPEARRLIEIVDGVTTVTVGNTGSDAAGYALLRPRAYELVLDLATVSQRNGQRGISRVVLHELAHVVEHALVPPELLRRLDATVPRGWSAAGQSSGSSASPQERFAESFAKWATGDIGVDLYLGYAVPPPPLDWGSPLAEVPAAGQ
jgi:hypothetical protein